MKRIVLDVNVVVSGFASPLGAPRTLVNQWLQREFELITSEHVLAAAERAWRNPYFRARYDERSVIRTLSLLRKRAIVVVPASSPRGVANDEEDDLVLAAAVTGQAEVLITGDNGVLRLASYSGIPMMTPRDYLNVGGMPASKQ